MTDYSFLSALTPHQRDAVRLLELATSLIALSGMFSPKAVEAVAVHLETTCDSAGIELAKVIRAISDGHLE